jgi:hypothetical protein
LRERSEKPLRNCESCHHVEKKNGTIMRPSTGVVNGTPVVTEARQGQVSAERCGFEKSLRQKVKG